MMPGIHDVHMHPLEASTSNFTFTVKTSITDPEKFIPIVNKASRANPGTNWLLGAGHALETILNDTRPPQY